MIESTQGREEFKGLLTPSKVSRGKEGALKDNFVGLWLSAPQ